MTGSAAREDGGTTGRRGRREYPRAAGGCAFEAGVGCGFHDSPNYHSRRRRNRDHDGTGVVLARNAAEIGDCPSDGKFVKTAARLSLIIIHERHRIHAEMRIRDHFLRDHLTRRARSDDYSPNIVGASAAAPMPVANSKVEARRYNNDRCQERVKRED